jgi:hypothetical protein
LSHRPYSEILFLIRIINSLLKLFSIMLMIREGLRMRMNQRHYSFSF